MVICTQCASENSSDNRFCAKCGYNLFGATGQLTPDTLLDGRYLITKTLGRGGMGAVYQALDRRLDNILVAIKEMSTGALGPGKLQDAIVAFKREAKILINLRHPALPRVIDFFSEGDERWYLVMDYIEGETLEEVASRRGQIPEAEVLNWTKQLCDVLEYLHSHHPPIIFRDLKPSNIMLTTDGDIKLIDFGIARHFKPGLTSDTSVYGSAGYSAPEQYGQSQTDARADIYSLGATMHYLLTGVDPGKSPFKFTPPKELVATISYELNSAIVKAVSFDIEQRPGSAKEMKNLLPLMFETSNKDLATSILKPAPQDPTATTKLPEKVTKEYTKNRVLWMVVVVGVVILTISSFAYGPLDYIGKVKTGEDTSPYVAEADIEVQANFSDSTMDNVIDKEIIHSNNVNVIEVQATRDKPTTVQDVVGVKLDRTNLTLTTQGPSVKLLAIISPANATNQEMVWSSSDTSVATVSAIGEVTPKNPGSATITVKTKDGGKTATCGVIVNQVVVAVSGVSLDRNILNLTAGGSSIQLVATVTPANATNKGVTWSSSNTAVATVSPSGVVSPLIAGITTITVRTLDGSKIANCNVTVNQAPVSGLSKLNSRVEYIKFFEEADRELDISSLKYQNRFSSLTSRYIYYELGLTHPQPESRIDFKIHDIYYRSDNSIFAQRTSDYYVLPWWTDSQHRRGEGWDIPGMWPVGNYRVELYSDGTKLATGWFEIY